MLKTLLPLALLAACSYAPPPQSAGQADYVNPRAGLNGQELRLIAGGLASGTPGLHTNRIFEFGMTRDEITAAVAAIRGPATGTESNGECGAGPMEFTRFGTLTLNFQNGRFVGWSLDGPVATPPIEEEMGLGIGTRRAHLGGDGGEARIETSTLGVEFDEDGIGGLLSSDAADATVTHLWAGTNCQFR